MNSSRKQTIRAAITPLVLLTPAMLVYAIGHYFNLHATEPVDLVSGLAITYIAMLVLGFGGHTFFETLYLAIFLSICGLVIISNEFPSFYGYVATCILLASWYNLLLWKLGKVFEQPPGEE